MVHVEDHPSIVELQDRYRSCTRSSPPQRSATFGALATLKLRPLRTAAVWRARWMAHQLGLEKVAPQRG
jgi:hypothetical protein